MFDENVKNFRQRIRFVTNARAQIIVRAYATNNDKNLQDLHVN